MPTVSLHFSEFGTGVVPNVAHFREWLPEASVEVRTEHNTGAIMALDPQHARYNMRMHNYIQIRQMLESKADVAIALDSDMWVKDIPRARSLVDLALKFGICLPVNPRHLIHVDTTRGVDSDGRADQLGGGGQAVNCSPIAFSTGDTRARRLLLAVKKVMEESPVRGTLAWVRGEQVEGIAAYKLPIQWCVCQENCGVGNEIMLHIGHPKVQTFYGVKYKPETVGS